MGDTKYRDCHAKSSENYTPCNGIGGQADRHYTKVIYRTSLSFFPLSKR